MGRILSFGPPFALQHARASDGSDILCLPQPRHWRIPARFLSLRGNAALRSLGDGKGTLGAYALARRALALPESRARIPLTDFIEHSWKQKRHDGSPFELKRPDVRRISATDGTLEQLTYDGSAQEGGGVSGEDKRQSSASEAVSAPAASDVPGSEQGTGDELSKAQLYWRAAKPPLYTVALVPLLVGAGASYYQNGIFYAQRFWSFLFYSVLVLAWLNLSNDAFDAETGVDKDKKESVVNITGSREGVLAAAFACLGLGVWGLLQGARAVGDPRVFQLLALSIACGYVYQSPPFRLSYKGLGEPLCFLAFGPSATSAFFLYQASNPGFPAPLSATVIAASILVGITTSLILFCSHFHQIESDLSVGKMSPLVRLGTLQGAKVATGAIAGLYVTSIVFTACSLLPWTVLPVLAVTLPIAGSCIRFINDNHSDKSAIFMAKYFCTRLHTAFGLMLALGLALGRLWPRILAL